MTLPNGAPIPTGAPLTHWAPDPLVIALLVVAGIAYARSFRRVRAAGARFPTSRLVAFGTGLGVTARALLTQVDVYSDVWFSVHVEQHLLVTLAAAPLFVLGAPVTLLLLASSSERRQRSILPFLRGRVVATLSRPPVAFALFVATQYVVHLTPLYDLALREPAVHVLEHVVFLGSGVLFWESVVGLDPAPGRRLGYPARLLVLALAIPLEGFLALAIFSARAPLYPAYAGLPAPWGPEALADQRAGAALMWLVSDAVMIGALLLTAASWRRHEDARTRSIERSAPS
ncbi:MAG: cytochrome c oxidase assembly protein [Actinomycetota bacterium]